MLPMNRIATIGILVGMAFLPAACTSEHNAPSQAREMSAPPAVTAGGPGVGMDMQTMTAHCADMRREARTGVALTSNTRNAMAECDKMDHMRGGTPPAPVR